MNNLPCSTKKNAGEEKCTSSEKCWIERPRYFNGQLLTDADLRAELNYVIEKNKLQNRYLHGWGVVCGLKVKCYPCCTGHGSSGKVVVEPGYAIDCCGNDIVVCDEQEYDVIKRINEIKKKKKAESDPCGPGVVEEEAPCDKAEEKYYLTISYKEVEAKPATALKAKDGCSIQSCVPSRTRECFELDLIEHCTLNKRIEDNFLKRATKCWEIYKETWTRVFNEDEMDFTGKSVEEIKNFIREYYKALPSHVRCSVLDDLDEIQVSEKDKIKLWILSFYLLLDCICQALLKPCPECTEDDVVILATITVKNKKIDKICNFSRKWVMTFPTLFYWLPINKWIGNFVKEICCELDLLKSGSLPLWMYMTKIVEKDFALPKTMTKNFQESLKMIPKSLFTIFDPRNVSLETALNKKSSESKALLEELKIDVARTERYEPSLKDFSLERIISTVPCARPGEKVVQYVDEEDNVVAFRTVKEEEVLPEKEVADLRKEMDEIKANISIMKSHMRRDAGSTIKTRLAIEKKYQPLTIELTRSLAKEIPPENLKDMGRVKAERMRKAKISSVLNVLEAVPAAVSDAVKEPITNALKYIDDAENLTLEVASYVAEGLKKTNIIKKEDLNKLDTKKIATKLKISEVKVKKAIEKIR